MHITKVLRKTVPYMIIGALGVLNAPVMASVILNAVKKEITKRDTASAKRALKDATFRTVLTRLKKQGLVDNPLRGLWRVTKKGMGIYNEASEKEAAYKKFIAEHGKQRDTIVIFDIPKKMGNARYYLRGELIVLGYKLLQKSVWIGGGPLPEQFIAYLKEKDLLSTVHIFTIHKRGTIA